jgi:hypothetical protein
MQKITNAAMRAGAPGTANRIANTGTRRIRETVIVFGIFSIALP